MRAAAFGRRDDQAANNRWRHHYGQPLPLCRATVGGMTIASLLLSARSPSCWAMVVPLLRAALQYAWQVLKT
jgi:hypothetical protein